MVFDIATQPQKPWVGGVLEGSKPVMSGDKLEVVSMGKMTLLLSM
jgi:hypothetical protein